MTRKRPSSVLIVGSARQESLESSYARAFRRLNIDVLLWDPRRAINAHSRGGAIGRLISTHVHIEPWVRSANADLLRLICDIQPDLILIIATSGLRAGSIAQLRNLRESTSIYMLYPDSPHNLDADRINCLRVVDKVIVSSPAWVSAFQQLGGRNVVYLPFAFDAELMAMPSASALTPSTAAQISFIGSWRPEREKLLDELSHFNLAVWGNAYWRTRTSAKSPTRAHWVGREAVGMEFARIVQESAVSINIFDVITSPGPNMRTFEIPGCRGFALCTRTSAVLDLFKEGETIECFESAAEAKEKIRFYLEHADARERIARAANDLVLKGGHTYLDRAKTIVTWVQSDFRL